MSMVQLEANIKWRLICCLVPLWIVQIIFASVLEKSGTLADRRLRVLGVYKSS